MQPPLKKVTPLFSSNLPLNIEILSSAPFLKIWSEAQLPLQKTGAGGRDGAGGAHSLKLMSLLGFRNLILINFFHAI